MSQRFLRVQFEGIWSCSHISVTSATSGICYSDWECNLESERDSECECSYLMELSFKLLQLILGRMSLNIIQNKDLSDISVIVAAIARQFAVLHNSLKFEALHLLNVILTSKDSAEVIPILFPNSFTGMPSQHIEPVGLSDPTVFYLIHQMSWLSRTKLEIPT
ncbi:hypothetical protein VNO80_26047 [Phaseolus coccineus]|uniref:Uncharacterized protein n=1 Tax=Phaseolus coccineus TaxID=3886 RepID=A0AAN9QP92_PHACN